MPITINLKQLESGDSDNLKLDKVNYNFDQLVANGGGPQGITGPQGIAGYQGPKGNQGPQGIQGDQGPQGSSGSDGTDYWERINGDISNLEADSLFPKHETPPTGHTLPPVVAIGYLSTDAEYGVEQPAASGQLNSQFIVNRKSYFDSNISFRADGVANSFDYTLKNEASTTVFEGSFIQSSSTGSEIRYFAGKHEFRSNTSGNNLIIIDDSQVLSTVNVRVENDLSIGGNLIINTTNAPGSIGSPDNGKIATSADNQGTIEFKTVDELGLGIPVGTIVQVLPSVFADPTYFIQTQTDTLGPTDLLDFEIGSGIGEYAGWYLCNGQTWTKGTTQYVVPDLNSFEYLIDDNPTALTGQGFAELGDVPPNLIGGSAIDMTAQHTGGGNYTVSHTIDTSTGTDIDESASGTEFTINRLPHIIYLGGPGFTYNIGGSSNPPYPITYNFVDNNSTPAEQFTTVSYTETHQSGSTSNLFNVFVTAPSGYSWDTKPAVTVVDLTIPSSLSGFNPTMGQSTIYTSSSLNDTFQFQFYVDHPTLGSGPYTIGIDSTGHLASAIANTYVYNTTANWTYDAANQTKTAVPGSTITLDPVVLSAAPGKYFDNTVVPTVPYASYGSGTSNITRTSDLSVVSHSYSTGSQPDELTITLQDSDFADASVVPAGITSNTKINFGATTYDLLPSLVPGGIHSVLSNNTSSTVSRSYYVNNGTGSNIYIAVWLTNNGNGVQFPVSATMTATWGTLSATTSGSENNTLNALSGTMTLPSATLSVQQNLVVDNPTGDGSWSARLIWTYNSFTTQNPWDAGQTQWNYFL